MRYNHSDKIRILSEVTSTLNEVGNTDRSISAEKVLEIIINMQNLSKSALEARLSNKKDDAAKFLVAYHKLYIKTDTPAESYFKAISQIRKYGIHPSALNVGSKSYPTTPVWRNYGGISSSTSKSDVITNKDTYSVKNASTQVRVLDASLPQLTALVNYTIDSIGVSDQIQKVVKANLSKMKRIQSEDGFNIKRAHDSSGKKLGLAQMRKTAVGKTKKMIAEFDKNSKELNAALNAIFKTVTNTPKFKSVFISESISGKTMFGTNSQACAGAILTWTVDFKDIQVHSIPTVTKAILNNFTMPQILTKTSGDRISKTFQAYYRRVHESISELDTLVEREVDLIHKSNMGLITEGVFSDLWNNLKHQGELIIDKIVDTIGLWIDKAIEIASAGWQEILAFLGMDLDIQVTDEYASITYDGISNAG